MGIHSDASQLSSICCLLESLSLHVCPEAKEMSNLRLWGILGQAALERSSELSLLRCLERLNGARHCLILYNSRFTLFTLPLPLQ